MNDQNKNNKSKEILDDIFNNADVKTKSFHTSDKPKNIKIKVKPEIMEKIANYEYEPESMSNWFRLKAQTELNQFNAGEIKPPCCKCSREVKKGEGIIMLNGGGIWHRDCFEKYGIGI